MLELVLEAAIATFMRSRGLGGVELAAAAAVTRILGDDLGGDYYTPEGRRAAAARALAAARD